MRHPVAQVRVRWLSAAEGGRSSLPSGASHACNGMIVGHDAFFSVVLRDPARVSVGDTFDKVLELTLLCPDLLPDIAERLTPGARVTIMEGSRRVADGEVLTVRMEEWHPKPAFSDPPVHLTDRR